MKSTTEIVTPIFPDVAAAPFRIAPERAPELDAHIKAAGVDHLLLVDGPARFVSMPGAEPHIRVSASALASLWALSYAAFHTIDVASRIAATDVGQAMGEIDLAPLWDGYSLRALMAFARQQFVRDTPWPDELPRPVFGADFDSDDGRVNNLFLAATSWIVLHEIGHMILGHSRKVSESLRLSQEEAADRFAVRWPLEHCPPGEEREFRVLAIIVAHAWLFLFELTSRGGGDHPAAIVRLWQAASLFDVPDDSPALENGVYALKAIFDSETIDMPKGMSAGEAFAWIDGRLAGLFPRG